MKWLFFLPLLVFFPLAEAAFIEINIAEVVESDIKNVREDTFAFSTELFNSGSVGYAARERVDVYDGEDLVYTGWTPEKVIAPGQREVFDLFWSPVDNQGEFRAVTTFYYAGEIKENDQFLIINDQISEDIFMLSDIRVYDDHFRMYLTSREPLENVVVFPSSPPGWVIEQKRIDSLAGGVDVVIPYSVEFYTERPLLFLVATEDGRYGHQELVSSKKQDGVAQSVSLFLDVIKSLFRPLA